MRNHWILKIFRGAWFLRTNRMQPGKKGPYGSNLGFLGEDIHILRQTEVYGSTVNSWLRKTLMGRECRNQQSLVLVGFLSRPAFSAVAWRKPSSIFHRCVDRRKGETMQIFMMICHEFHGLYSWHWSKYSLGRCGVTHQWPAKPAPSQVAYTAAADACDLSGDHGLLLDWFLGWRQILSKSATGKEWKVFEAAAGSFLTKVSLLYSWDERVYWLSFWKEVGAQYAGRQRMLWGLQTAKEAAYCFWPEGKPVANQPPVPPVYLKEGCWVAAAKPIILLHYMYTNILYIYIYTYWIYVYSIYIYIYLYTEIYVYIYIYIHTYIYIYIL